MFAQSNAVRPVARGPLGWGGLALLVGITTLCACELLPKGAEPLNLQARKIADGVILVEWSGTIPTGAQATLKQVARGPLAEVPSVQEANAPRVSQPLPMGSFESMTFEDVPSGDYQFELIVEDLDSGEILAGPKKSKEVKIRRGVAPIGFVTLKDLGLPECMNLPTLIALPEWPSAGHLPPLSGQDARLLQDLYGEFRDLSVSAITAAIGPTQLSTSEDLEWMKSARAELLRSDPGRGLPLSLRPNALIVADLRLPIGDSVPVQLALRVYDMSCEDYLGDQLFNCRALVFEDYVEVVDYQAMAQRNNSKALLGAYGEALAKLARDPLFLSYQLALGDGGEDLFTDPNRQRSVLAALGRDLRESQTDENHLQVVEREFLFPRPLVPERTSATGSTGEGPQPATDAEDFPASPNPDQEASLPEEAAQDEGDTPPLPIDDADSQGDAGSQGEAGTDVNGDAR